MTTSRIVRLMLATVVLGAALNVGGFAADEPSAFKVFYFGNSFLENSVPWFHPTLAATAGHQMQVQTQLGPGWQTWMHVDTFYKNPDGAKKTLGEGDWDAVVIQHFGAHPLLKDNVRKTVFHNQEPFPERGMSATWPARRPSSTSSFPGIRTTGGRSSTTRGPASKAWATS